MAMDILGGLRKPELGTHLIWIQWNRLTGLALMSVYVVQLLLVAFMEEWRALVLCGNDLGTLTP